MKYASIEDIEGYLVISINESFYNQVNAWIEGVSRKMDGIADRVLVAPAIGSGEDYEERYFDGNSRGFISIEDCQEIIGIQEGDEYGANLTSVESDNFITYPRIAPFRKIIKKSGTFLKGMQNIRVEGRFGYFNEVPEDLRFACSVIVAGIINNYNKGPQTVTSERYVDYQVNFNSDKGWADYQEAVATVEKYKKIGF